MSRRGGGSLGDGFSSSYSRRPAGGSGMSSGSLLGDPPRRQQQQQLYDPFAESERDTGRSYGRSGSGGGDAYDRGGGYATGTYSSSSSAQMGYGPSSARNDYGSGSFGAPVLRQRDGTGVGQDSGSTWRKRSPSPPPHHHNDSEYGRGRSPVSSWSGQQNRGYDNRGQQQSSSGMFKSGNMQSGSGMGMGMTPQQQLVMVVPQGQGGSSGLMGMMPVTPGQNPFGQRQAPMQVILGNLPAFNPNIFDQQLLASASGPFGNSAQMGGMMNPNQQRGDFGRSPGSSAYGRDARGSDWKDRIGRNNSANQRNSLGSASAGRRSDSNRSNLVHRAGGRGSLSGIGNSPNDRGGRKRINDRAAEEIERKKARPGLPNSNNRDRVARTSLGTPGTPNTRAQNRAAQHKKKLENNKNKNGQTPNKPKPILKNSGQQQKTPAKGDGGKGKDGKATPSKNKTAETAEGKKEAAAADSKKIEGDNKEVVILDNKEAVAKDGETITDTESKDEKVEDETEKTKKKSKYDEFPSDLLVCKVCQKAMNDGASYESHLNGRAHTALVKIVEARFQKRAELLMYESKLAEEEIGVELERQRRAGKQGSATGSKNKNHCKMCDCNYAVNWGTHKISLGHRILKEFLHPTCRYCDSQFVHRMDWLNHLFSLTHIRRLYELKAEGKDLTEQSTPYQDELFAISIEMNSEEHPINFITIRNSDWKIPTKDDLKELLQEDAELEIPEGDIIIPKEHDENVVVGEDMILKTTGYCCKVCRVYMTQEKEVLPHLQNRSHFGMYVGYLKKLAKLKEIKKKQEADAAAAVIAAAETEAAEIARKEAEKLEAENKAKEAEETKKVSVVVPAGVEAGVEKVASEIKDEVQVVEPTPPKPNPGTSDAELIDLADDEGGDEPAPNEVIEDQILEDFTVEDEVAGDDETMDTDAVDTNQINGEESIGKNDVEMAETGTNEEAAVPEVNAEDGVEAGENVKVEISVEEPAKEKVDPEPVKEKEDLVVKKDMPPPAAPAAARTPQVATRGNRGVRGNRGGPPRGNAQGQGPNRGGRGGGGGPGSFQGNRGTSGPGPRGRGGPVRRPGNAGVGGVRGRGRGRPY